MKSALKAYIRFIDRLNKGIFWIVAVLIGFLSLLIFAQVVFRYALGQSLSWSEELARFMMIWLVLLGTGLAIRRRTMIAVEAIMQVVPEKVEYSLRITIYVLSLVFAACLLVKGFEMMLEVHQQRSSALSLPMSVPYAAIPIGAFLLILNIKVVLFETILKTKEEQNLG